MGKWNREGSASINMGNTPHIPPDARDWLTLSTLKGIGPARFMQLVSAFGSPRAALEAAAREWAALLSASWQKSH